ncbi:cytochrome-c oxidase, cbb3-type subunit III [Aurantimonas sp. 22II-16-19i]|uniref:cytochrome-c oxidase, cbb3-type subunit III n=1 Tax=Aurantimonas sp. 22II-16-19i TaxID=1317114 RepID=UPI0009F7A355|nr:cytochrome-c oxidase, cbb3-type subunit III [Aurantimonas sp. 22II-16-19i]ORE89997.1 cytochrome-c oxidase, FixP chain [Aurantimonas sp. 22II-16-19i]
MADHKDVDQITGVETTGHSWDGIKELNNPLPRWWLWTFYATIVFALVYTVLYPAWPMVNSATTGLLGWSSRGDLGAELAAANAARAGQLEKISALSVEEIAADPDLRTVAIAGGRAAFKVNCVQCHGSGAEGGPGYPNLNDDAWLWGGQLDAIHTTLEHGIRYASDADTRVSEMPAFGRDGILDRAQIGDVADYVLTLGGTAADPAAAERGAVVYAENCAACHGDGGEGMREVGAPALNDAIWLFGGAKDDIVRQVTTPRHGVMPAWGTRLGETTVKELTVYVHSLGGGE